MAASQQQNKLLQLSACGYISAFITVAQVVKKTARSTKMLITN